MSAQPPQSRAPGIDEIRQLVADAVHPAHFFVGPAIELEWQRQPREEIAWEVFRGRLLDAAQTRQRQTFEAWNIYLIDPERRSTEPLLSVKLSAETDCFHVTRSVHSYVWEGYDAGDNVFLSRETRKWVRELIGTIALAGLDATQLRESLQGRIFQAVVGTSRLPLTSIEAPLPAFTLGQLAYFPRTAVTETKPMRSPRELIARALDENGPRSKAAKLLEIVLRATPHNALADMTDQFAARWQEIGRETADIVPLLRTVFSDVALSPYTDFVDKALAFVRLLEERGHIAADEHADFLGGLLRQLGRHLSAYDLVVFHHRGANYPDALLLDAALGALLNLAERCPQLFELRLRRRALRQACLLRRKYEGHDVPDAPTSPGENARVLPAPHARVPEEQITDPTRRGRKLFADRPLSAMLGETARGLLRQGVADLDCATELRELGMALFLDRPLGVFKRPGEPDQTLLLSYEAFSLTLAERRLRELAELVPEAATYGDRLRSLDTHGLTLMPSRLPQRPGAATLDDLFKVAPDFVLLRTTRRTAADFFAAYGLAPVLARFSLEHLAHGRVLIVSGAALPGKHPGLLAVFDDQYRQRLEFEIDAREGYTTTPRGEQPTGGLRLLRVWTRDGTAEHDLSGADTRSGLHAGEPGDG
jgi:hypothetical protein